MSQSLRAVAHLRAVLGAAAGRARARGLTRATAGTYELTGNEAYQAVTWALEVGVNVTMADMFAHRGISSLGRISPHRACEPLIYLPASK